MFLRQSKVAAALALVLIPAGISLDLLTYPDKLQTLVAIRLYGSAMIAVLYALHFWPTTAAHVRYLTMAGMLTAAACIIAMIGVTDGVESDYYLGLFLIVFAVGVLSPVEPAEAAIFCCATITLYICSCASVVGHPGDANQMMNNLYFLTLTSVITVTACHVNRRRRFNEFKLKFRLAQQHDKLQMLDKLKSQFFANVSHELRTPLTLILAPVEKLKSGASELAPESTSLVEIIENNALRLLRLVNDILSLIRLEEGSARLNKGPLNLASYIKQLTAAMRHLADMKQIRLTCTIAPGELMVDADRDAMEKIFSNILANAIKFTPTGGHIEVDATRQGNDVVIEISDDGIGIPADKLARVFDRFYQVDGSETRRYQGLGLGLALVHELVTRHEGTVEARNRDGDGTTFRLTFPLAAAPAEGASADADGESPVIDILKSFDRKAIASTLSVQQPVLPDLPVAQLVSDGRPRILIVDDEPDMRRYLVTMLKDDYHIIEAGDGPTGLLLARELEPDAILLDVMLPGMSGLDVCHALKASAATRATKIIMLTARADQESKLVALKNGADDFLLKPFSGLEVRTRIENLLQSARLERNLQRVNAELETSLQQLRETEAILVQNARLSALGTMAAGLLHEIGNPLNFMGTALYLIARNKTVVADPQISETLVDVQEGFERIKRVVTDLRGFTAPQKPETSRAFPARDAIQHALRFTAHVKKDVEVDLTIGDTPPVYGSISLISQVLVNLLANAYFAVRQVEHLRHPKVAISSLRQGDRVIIKVRDNGTGIDPAVIDKIFDPFFSTKDVGEGMGLGLAVSHQIIRNHGGSLTVSSNVAECTEFSIDLPSVSNNDNKTIANAIASV